MNVVFLDNSNKVGRDGCLGMNRIYSQYAIWRKQTEINPLIHVLDRRRGQGSNRNTISRGQGGGGSCPKRVLDACVNVCPSFSRFLHLCWIINYDNEYFAYQETIPGVQVRMLKEMPLEI